MDAPCVCGHRCVLRVRNVLDVLALLDFLQCVWKWLEVREPATRDIVRPDDAIVYYNFHDESEVAFRHLHAAQAGFPPHGHDTITVVERHLRVVSVCPHLIQNLPLDDDV
jgi:hypothetical protein